MARDHRNGDPQSPSSPLDDLDMLIIEDNNSSQTEDESSSRAKSPEIPKQLIDGDIAILETNEETRSKTAGGAKSQLLLRRSDAGSQLSRIQEEDDLAGATANQWTEDSTPAGSHLLPQPYEGASRLYMKKALREALDDEIVNVNSKVKSLDLNSRISGQSYVTTPYSQRRRLRNYGKVSSLKTDMELQKQKAEKALREQKEADLDFFQRNNKDLLKRRMDIELFKPRQASRQGGSSVFETKDVLTKKIESHKSFQVLGPPIAARQRSNDGKSLSSSKRKLRLDDFIQDRMAQDKEKLVKPYEQGKSGRQSYQTRVEGQRELDKLLNAPIEMKTAKSPVADQSSLLQKSMDNYNRILEE